MVDWTTKRKGVSLRLVGVSAAIAFEITFMILSQFIKADNFNNLYIIFFSFVFCITLISAFVFRRYCDRKPHQTYKERFSEHRIGTILLGIGFVFVGAFIAAASIVFNSIITLFIGAIVFSACLLGYIFIPTWNGFW